MRKSHFHIADMDCPSEEQQIRSLLSNTASVKRLDFDLPKRKLIIWHSGEDEVLERQLEQLKLGSRLEHSELVPEDQAAQGQARDQGRVLRLLLGINATMFVVELVAGLLGDSTGLLSDSLDMFADALVYGMALWAVGGARGAQERAAMISGWLELALALGVLAQVAHHAIVGVSPEAPVMMGTAFLALIANAICVLALAGHREEGAHMRASWIFSTNDVIANLGVIVAGALVYWTASPLPDLIVGTLIGLIVMRGALRILAIARGSAAVSPRD